MIVRVQFVPKSPPGYVSVVLDRRVKGRGKIVTLHSFGRYSFEQAARAEQFRVNCELALRLYSKAITQQDQDVVFAVFGQTLGVSTLEKLLQAARPKPEISVASSIVPLSKATKSLRNRRKWD